MARPLLEVQELKKTFPARGGRQLRAVDGVSFTIERGETLGLVGESGCGKSTTGRTIVRLYQPSAGRVLFDGEEVHSLHGSALRRFRRRVQMIFQDPLASLDPRMTVGDTIAEGMQIHHMGTPKERQERVQALLRAVGLNPEHASRFPHEFSGGQRQRIGIARALAVQPELIVADEPISALDVSIQAQIVNLLERLQQEMGLTYLFIAHDLSMVKHISTHVGVMYLGALVEIAPTDQLYSEPLHPYTQALLSAAPLPDPKVTRTRPRVVVQGEVPSPIDLPSGCRFRTRCPFAMDICSQVDPPLIEVAPQRQVACHLHAARSTAA
ncbi:MAG: ATP-binding cassette domain-containing protein [Firmicutes bacterium]|nr:ATP-binding cassette domain-containing protein [Bacillota bacterium]